MSSPGICCSARLCPLVVGLRQIGLAAPGDGPARVGGAVLGR
jgi:hypothetical protein